MDFVHPSEVEQGILERYRVLFLPFPYYIRRSTARILQQWVAGGGTLIGESYVAGWDPEAGAHQSVVPGHGLSTVFQARQGEVQPAADNETVSMSFARPWGSVRKGEIVKGSVIRESLIPEGAKVLARFKDGSPAVTLGRHGKGTAVAIGSFVGRQYAMSGDPSTRKFFASLAALASRRERPKVSGPVRVDVLAAPGKGTLVMIRNLAEKPWKGSIGLPQDIPGSMKEQFTGRSIKGRRSGKGLLFSFVLGPREVRVYRA